MLLVMLGSVTGAWAQEPTDPCADGHTFDPNDDTQCVCTVCNHGFFRYEGTGLINRINKIR